MSVAEYAVVPATAGSSRIIFLFLTLLKRAGLLVSAATPYGAERRLVIATLVPIIFALLTVIIPVV